ncbi:MAG TPA: PadR family transcriptional regulator [Candidatus Baltobacteraceae bacterium]|nr:PadR family transcriptional regulator [Candidatus Baltobacteraceae bacterium]
MLKVLDEGERHGYDLMRFLHEKGWGAPGPGSVYPVLNALEEEGLVVSRTEGERRVYEITEKGRRHLSEHLAHAGNFFESFFEPEAPGAQAAASADSSVRDAAARLMQAVSQMGASSKPETIERVRELLDRCRKDIYLLLAQE